MPFKLFYSPSGVRKQLAPPFALVLLLLFLPGCSTIHNYQLLSFFFDGVPNPNAKDSINSQQLTNPSDTALVLNQVNAPPKNSFHQPYKERECTACHDKDKLGKLTQSPPELCYQCHDDFSKKYKVLHSPVESGDCTSCHSPHMSVNDKLLKRTGQALCFECHDSKEILANDTHKDIQTTSCTECHLPHGGAEKTFLR